MHPTLYPVNNAINAKGVFNNSAAEMKELDKVGDGGNKYQVRFDGDGFGLLKEYESEYKVEVVDCWVSGSDVVMVARLWGIER